MLDVPKGILNEAMRPSRLQKHATKIYIDRKDKNLSYSQALERDIENATYIKPFCVVRQAR